MSDYNRSYRPMPFPINQSVQTLTLTTRELKEMIECYLRNKGQIVSVGDFDVDPVKLIVTVVNSIAASFNLTPQPLAIEPGVSGGGTQLQAFADAGSYWLDSVELPPVFVAETGSYWLDSVTTLPVFVAESGSYWLDSFEAAFAETGSYWLDSAVASPLVVAETGSYSLDSVEAAFAESGSYWLDSAVESPVFVAETGVYWLDSAEAAIAESGSYWLDSALILTRYSSAQVTLLGSAGMTNIYTGDVDDANVVLGDLGFDYRYYEGTFRTNVYIGSNSYLTFGFGSNEYSGLTRVNPLGKTLHLGSDDRSYQNVFVQASAGSFRVRYEGAPARSGASSRFLEITLFADGAMMVVKQTPDNSGLWTVTKGDGISFTDFTPSAETSFVITPNTAFTVYTVQPGSYI